jgi:hypothetical protein
MSIFSCKDTACLASESLDHKLTFWRRLALGFHLLMCSPCRRFFRMLLFLRGAGRRLDDPGGQGRCERVGLSAEARQRMKQALSNNSLHERNHHAGPESQDW